MPGKIPITETEFKELCAKHTREEIAQIKGATENWVWAKTKEYGVKPERERKVLPRLQNSAEKEKKQTCVQAKGKRKKIKRIRD